MNSITKFLNEKELIDLTKKMVQISSVSGDEENLANFEIDYCKKIGLDAEKDKHGNVIVRFKGKNTGPVIALNSHLDTVGFGDGWTRDPLGATIEGDLMYGRGAADCKSSLAIHIMAVKALKDSEAELNGEVIIMHPVEEEVQNASKKGTYKMLMDGFKADMAINGEATNMQICVACEGMLEVLITTYGKRAHGSNPKEGINAIDHMCEIIKELNKIVPNVNKYTGSGSIVPGVISGGERSSVVPDMCTLKVSRFIVPGEDGPMFLKQINDIITKLTSSGTIHHATAELTYQSKPSLISEDESIVQELIASHKRLGYDYEISGTPQHDDADYLVNMGNIPTVIFGPGRTVMAHVPDECVEVSDVIKAAKIYIDTLYSIMS